MISACRCVVTRLSIHVGCGFRGMFHICKRELHFVYGCDVSILARVRANATVNPRSKLSHDITDIQRGRPVIIAEYPFAVTSPATDPSQASQQQTHRPLRTPGIHNNYITISTTASSLPKKEPRPGRGTTHLDKPPSFPAQQSRNSAVAPFSTAYSLILFISAPPEPLRAAPVRKSEMSVSR